MKKLLKKITAYSLVLLSLIAISACSKDDDNNLKGFWATDEVFISYKENYHTVSYNHILYVIEFVNHNTLNYYDDLIDKNLEGFGYKTSININGKIWYCNNPSTYTYTFEDNKVYIPMRGEILTLSGKKLFKDGSSEVFTKQ